MTRPPRHSPLAQALFDASDDLDDPLAICALVQRVVRENGYVPVGRAELLEHREICRRVADGDPSGRHPRWKFTLGHLTVLIERELARGEPNPARPDLPMARSSVYGVCLAIRMLLDGWDWYRAHQGGDPEEARRGVFIDTLARMLPGRAPQAWERDLMGRAIGEPLLLTLGQRIRARRQGRGLSAAELARRLGVSRATLVRWEAGVRRPRPAHRDALARELGGQPSEYSD